MSGAEGKREATTTRAEEVEEQAANWLARRVSEDWSDDEQACLNVWLAESAAHRIAFLRLDGAWSHTYRLAVLRRSEQEPATAARKLRPAFGKAVAALVVLAVLGMAGAAYLLKPHQEIFATTTGSHKTITLADGSQIELNTDTVVRTSLETNQRSVWLDKGEVYFQIRHDAARPFVVTAGGIRVMDLGTKFLVRRNTGRLEVAVMDGRVRFDTAQDATHARSTILTPGDVIVATATATVRTRETAQKLANELSWRHGLLSFDNATLATVAAEFNRYNGAKIVIADPTVNKLVIGGTFPTNDVKAFAELAQDVLGLHVEKRGDETVISR